MNYGIVIFPSKSLQDKANAYRKRYDPHYALITPHLTLKNVFTTDDSGIKDIADKLRQIAKQYDPFNMKVYKISSFQPVNNVIYFKVEPNPELEGLHKAMHSAEFNEQEPEFAFVPHITVAQNLSDDEHSDVFGSLRMLGIDHEETVDRFHLLYQLENGSWTVYETFRLGKE